MTGRFGIGQAVPRGEDVRLLTGGGRYVADIVLPGEARALVLRSPHAHAEVVAIDGAAALALPGVLAVVTTADLDADRLGDIPCAIPVEDERGAPLPRPGRPLLARERVRFEGEPVAFVVAETLAAARDALDAIAVDYRPLPAVASIEDATAPDAPLLRDAAPGNIAFFWQSGDAAAVDAALAEAAHVVRLDLVNNRVVPNPMEPRAAIGDFDPATGRFTLYTSSQGAHPIRDTIARATLRVPPDRLRVVVPDVGGGFGTKIFHYPEEALVLWAAQRLGRPVKWIGGRADCFLGDTHGRDQRNRLAAAFAADGRLLGLRVETLAGMGAYLNSFGPAIPSQMTGCMLSGAYAVPAIHATCRGVYTNTVPVDAYRGAGRPEATYVIERLMDAAARRLGLCRAEIRRRNFVRPEQMPYRTASGPTYDSGDFPRLLDTALAAAGWDGFESRRAEAAARSRLRGIGLSSYVEICGFDEEQASLRLTSDGGVDLAIGTQSTGQGHATAYAQIVADRLGVPFESVRVIQGDTSVVAFGRGTSGSRSLPVGGHAVASACTALLDRALPFARALLQAEDAVVRFEDGRFVVEDSDAGIDLSALARADDGDPGRTLQATARFALDASTFPNGTHVCEVEIDPETGLVEVVGYHVVDDFGTVINPLLLAGQIQGGVAQGIGQALTESTFYDRETGQLLTASFVDYGLPRATDVPFIDSEFVGVPCATNPLGVKGGGEAGTIAACPAVVNAALDALAPLGVTHVDMPLAPEKIWRAIRSARP